MGKMATWLPLPGAVPVYAARYIDSALGFTLGWNYWYQFAIGVPIEISAAALVIDYRPNNAPTVHRIMTALGLDTGTIPVQCWNTLNQVPWDDFLPCSKTSSALHSRTAEAKW
jgi:L-asparagine transporter-like permease